jgi:hypothetical protein
MKVPASLGRWLQRLKTQEFPDGYSVVPRNREEFLVTLPSGDVVVAYVFVAGPDCEFDRVIVKESVAQSIDGKPISDSDQAGIIRKMGLLSHFRGQKVGLQESRLRPPVSLERTPKL